MDLFTPGQRISDYGNGKDPYDYAGSLIVQRGSTRFP